jgi:hypothetical protein
MSRAQIKTAAEHPCYLAEETAHPRFYRINADGRSIAVTLDTGYE